jgi:hypothetical protein
MAEDAARESRAEVVQNRVWSRSMFSSRIVRSRKDSVVNQPARVQLQHAQEDFAVARNFSHLVKMACDDVYGDPFDASARAALLTVLLEQGPVADAALSRLLPPS